jgi:hypothetical protein
MDGNAKGGDRIMKAAYFCERPENILRVYDEARARCWNRRWIFCRASIRARMTICGTWVRVFHVGHAGFVRRRDRPPPSEIEGGVLRRGIGAVFARHLHARGIRVFSAWAANAVPVAEYAVSQIVLAGKDISGTAQAGRRRQAQAFADYAHSFPCNYETHVGILGAGMIESASSVCCRDTT